MKQDSFAKRSGISQTQSFRFLAFLSLIIFIYFGMKFNLYSAVIGEINGESFQNYNVSSQNLVFDAVSQQDFPIDGYGLATKIDPYSSSPYISLFGIQGYMFKSVEFMGCTSQSCMQTISALLFSSVLAIMIWLMWAKISKSLSAAILICYVSSPWITLLAKNVYWIPFTWVLPTVIVLWLLIGANDKRLFGKFAYLLLYLTFVLKFLAGYEYATSIMLLASSPPILLAYSRSNANYLEIKSHFRQHVSILATGMVGFFTALVIHANLRGSTILNGLLNIYVNDVQRRTFGKASDFPEIYSESLDASILDVLQIYLFKWSTDVLSLGKSGVIHLQVKQEYLLGLLALSFCVSISRAIIEENNLITRIFDSGTYANSIALLIPLTWIILAKSHSYIHTHLNFVLWYLLTIPVLFWTMTLNIKWIYWALRKGQPATRRSMNLS